jgi:acetyl-CoA carboxylase carboxyltransferase component
VRFGWVLAAIADPVERQNLFDKLVEAAYQHGKALTSATTFELDDVIDPADTRGWIIRLLFREAHINQEAHINLEGGRL